jgi:flavin reductase (DIM6/NTAB) family NADH-FMN oxidoreductase RutF
MNYFHELLPAQISTNVFEDIGKKWLIIGCQDSEKNRINVMTASWGAMGILWGKPVCILFVRPQRYSFELIEKSDRFSASVFGESYREKLRFCGTKSGRSEDKVAACGFTPVSFDGTEGFEEADMVLSLRKLYSDDLKESSFLDSSLVQGFYAAKDFHRMYVCEIEKVLVK